MEDKIAELKNMRFSATLFMAVVTTIFFFAKIIFTNYFGIEVETGTNILIDILRVLIVLPIYIVGELIRGFLHPAAVAVQMKFGQSAGAFADMFFVAIGYFFASFIVWAMYIYVGVEVIIQYLKHKIKTGKEISKNYLKKKTAEILSKGSSNDSDGQSS